MSEKRRKLEPAPQVHGPAGRIVLSELSFPAIHFQPFSSHVVRKRPTPLEDGPGETLQLHNAEAGFLPDRHLKRFHSWMRQGGAGWGVTDRSQEGGRSFHFCSSKFLRGLDCSYSKTLNGIDRGCFTPFRVTHEVYGKCTCFCTQFWEGKVYVCQYMWHVGIFFFLRIFTYIDYSSHLSVIYLSAEAEVKRQLCA